MSMREVCVALTAPEGQKRFLPVALKHLVVIGVLQCRTHFMRMAFYISIAIKLNKPAEPVFVISNSKSKYTLDCFILPRYNTFTYSGENHHRYPYANVLRVENCSNLLLRKNKTPPDGRNN